MDKLMFRVYRRDYAFGRQGKASKWQLRAAFVSQAEAGAYMQTKVDCTPCDVISIDWKIMQGNRNISWTARCK